MIVRRRPLHSGHLMGAGFLALSFFIASAVIFSAGQQGSDAVVRRALQIEIELAELFSALQDAETGQRGFLLTGDEAFLAPYRQARTAIDSQLTTLGRSIAPIEELSAPFAELRTLATQKQAELAETLALAETGRREEAMTLIRAGAGRRLMDTIRERIVALDKREDGIVDKRQASLRGVGEIIVASTIGAVVLLGLVALAAMREVRRRAHLARFLPAEIAPRLAAGDRSLLAGREVDAAVVFVDIRGSTALAETLPPTEVSLLLSSFRRAVTLAARQTDGLVDKFIGDGALTVFGAVENDPAACGKALLFAKTLRAVLAGNATRSLEIGVGVHYGSVFCGIVGCEERQEFTVLGDTVNVASRLEAMTKTAGESLLVSEEVLLAAGEPLEAWRRIGNEPLRGRQKMITVYAESRDRDGLGPPSQT